MTSYLSLSPFDVVIIAYLKSYATTFLNIFINNLIKIR